MGVESGSFTWLMVKSFEAATGVEFKMVDVGSNSEKCTALLGGHIDVMPNQHSTAKGYIDSGDFMALGFPTEERSAVYPDVTINRLPFFHLKNGPPFRAMSGRTGQRVGEIPGRREKRRRKPAE